MSLSVSRCVLKASGRLARCGARLGGAVGRGRAGFTPGIEAAVPARSLGIMCNRIQNKKLHGAGCRCGCRGLHTQGDQALSDFLAEEIGLEEKSAMSPASAVKDFQVVSKSGAEVELQKKHENETITILLNVNGTVDDDALDEEMKEQEPPQMVSKPPFKVTIDKGGDTVLVFQCSFPPPDDSVRENPEDGQHYEDLIEVEEVALLKKGEKWEDGTYCVQGSILDGNLYDMLLGVLEERGIDGPFVEQLVKYSTAYEHTKYVSFLQTLKDFANAK